MIETEMENERIGYLRVQRFGEAWVRSVSDAAPARIETFCHPDMVSVVLTPKRYMTLENAPALVAKYRDWFGTCTDFQLVTSRVGWVGERLGIFYSFLLQDGGDWYRIEQQLYCTLREGRVEKLHLLCSGFQLVGDGQQTAPLDRQAPGDPEPVRDALLELHVEAPETSSTCAVLTPMIRAKLRDVQSGQVLEVRVNDPSARDDIEAWSRLSGNTLLKVVDNEGQVLRFFVKKK